MKTTIDKAGRVVIPSPIRRRALLRAGTALEVTYEDGALKLVRSVPAPRLVRVGRRLVAKPTVPAGKRPQVDMPALVEEERNRWPW